MYTAAHFINLFIGDRFVCPRENILLTYLLEKVSCAHGNTFYKHIYWRTFQVHPETHFINIFIGDRFV